MTIALSTLGHVSSDSPADIVSLSLTCAPAERGVHCRLQALSRDVRRSPRDVTSEALWICSGVSGAHISSSGTVDAPTNGDVVIEARFLSRQARVAVRLIRDRPGQLLATVRGSVYVETPDGLGSVARARVAVVDGPSAGMWTSTRDDGRFELVGVVPGEATIRVTKTGYESEDVSTTIGRGESHVNVLTALSAELLLD
jgi:hypothetical protein